MLRIKLLALSQRAPKLLMQPGSLKAPYLSVVKCEPLNRSTAREARNGLLIYILILNLAYLAYVPELSVLSLAYLA